MLGMAWGHEDRNGLVETGPSVALQKVTLPPFQRPWA